MTQAKFAVDHPSLDAHVFHVRGHLEKKGLDLGFADDRTIGQGTQKGHFRERRSEA
jgi:hypothetical protein